MQYYAQSGSIEMKKRLAALAEDRVLSRIEKEIVIKTAVCSVFRYSAGFVDWTRSDRRSRGPGWTISPSCGSARINKRGHSLVALTAPQ